MDTETKAKAKDNNRRLAALEAGVSALAIALTANGIAIATGADPIEEAIKAIKFFAEVAEGGPAKIEALETELHNLAGYASGTIGRLVPDLDLAPQTDERPFAYLERLTLAANPRIDELIAAKAANAELKAKIEALGTPGTDAAELDELRKRVKELELENAELQTDVDDLSSARNALANQLAAEGKSPTPPAPDAAPVVEAPPPEPVARPAAARDIGPEYAVLTAVAIAALVKEGGPFELAFSNGEFEIIDFATAPIKIKAQDLARVDSSRWIVTPALNVKGGMAPATIHGAGLIYSGEQVGYCRFDPPALIGPGQERKFDRSLIFG